MRLLDKILKLMPPNIKKAPREDERSGWEGVGALMAGPSFLQHYLIAGDSSGWYYVNGSENVFAVPFEKLSEVDNLMLIFYGEPMPVKTFWDKCELIAFDIGYKVVSVHDIPAATEAIKVEMAGREMIGAIIAPTDA